MLQREITLLRQRTLARAQVTAADGDLDQFLEAFNNVMLTLVGNDRAAELYRRFFARRPSELKRPVLGEQLATMAGWTGTLEKLESPELAAQGQKLQPLVQKGKEAEAALQLAVQELDDFATLKEHKAFVDRLNATRSRLHGNLNELRHARPELNLPADFAEQFFLRDERSRGPTLTAQKKTVERLEKQLERQREILSRLEGEVAAARNPIHGADRITRFLGGVMSKLPANLQSRPAYINGEPGVLLLTDGQLYATMVVECAEGRVRAVHSVRNPDKLAHLA